MSKQEEGKTEAEEVNEGEPARDLLPLFGRGTMTGVIRDQRARPFYAEQLWGCYMKRILGSVSSVFAIILLLSACASGASASDFEITIKVTPNSIVLASEGTWVTVHTDIGLYLVDTASLALSGVPVAWTKADARGNLVAKFDQAEVKAIVAPREAALELTGYTNDGLSFSGFDTVAVK
jgi:hypothetical protein